MRQRAPFRRLVDQLLTACADSGIEVSRAAVEDLLADRVTIMAATLRVTEDTIVRSYLSTIDPDSIVAAFKAARADGQREVAATPPTILDLPSAGRLVASLGQAVRCVSLNHDALAGSSHDKWEAIGVLDSASNGLTLLGAAMHHPDTTGRRVSVLLSDETVVHARRALTPTVRNLTTGTWSFDSGQDIDTGVAARMAEDLALLPPA